MRHADRRGAVARPMCLIVGPGRSGSTLLSRLLADRIPAAANLGESWRLWHDGPARRVACQCGRDAPDCVFWSAVLGRTPDGTLASRGAVGARMARTGGRTSRRDRQVIGEALDDVHRALPEDVAAVIDSSKVPGFARTMYERRAGEVTAVILYRPCGATVHGDLRRRPAHRRGAGRAAWVALSWLRRVVAHEALAMRFRPRVVHVHYDEIVRDPSTVTLRIARAVGPVGPAPATAAHHLLGGSAVSVEPIVVVRADDRWRAGLTRSQGMIAAVVDVMGRLAWKAGRRLEVRRWGTWA